MDQNDATNAGTPDNLRHLATLEVPERVDDKYIVLKRGDLEELMSVAFAGDPPNWIFQDFDAYAVPDAVVIRTRDKFAGPTLQAYANTIALVAEAFESGEIFDNLIRVSDYLADRAREADLHEYEGTSKWPD